MEFCEWAEHNDTKLPRVYSVETSDFSGWWTKKDKKK